MLSEHFNAAMINELYEKGIMLLEEGKISEAVEALKKALELKPDFKEARFVLHELEEAEKWNVKHFCRKCGKLLTPSSEFPWLRFTNFCPNCGQIVNLGREEMIALGELFIKFISFGPFLLFLLIFCAIPFRQATLTGIWRLWNPLIDGILLAVTFTPIVVIVLLIIGDPWGSGVRQVYFATFNPLKSFPHLFFVVSLILLFIAIYLYYFLLLTPFLAMHKKGVWRSRKNHKKILKYSIFFFGFIVFVRILSGIFY